MELPQQPPGAASRLLIISHDIVDASMAGPGIRYWQLARVLAQSCDVTLAVPRQSTLVSQGFDVRPYDIDRWQSLQGMVNQADVIMPCGFLIRQFPELVNVGRPLVIDGYDPYLFETLARYTHEPAALQMAALETCQQQLEQECLHGDFYLCASERQRNWWIGMLQTYGRINMTTFSCDPTLRTLVAVVPFGCSSQPLQKTRPVLKGVTPNIGLNDKVLLWGGGIWDWLDPLTLLRAMREIVNQRPDVKLVFPGTRHPNPGVPDMGMRQQAVQLAQESGLLNTHVFFGDWVPYADWQNYLLEADVGVSLHFDSLETQMAFRSRVLDYIRGNLPMVVSRGDATSELVSQYGLGIVVDYEDVAGVTRAILQLLAETRTTRQAQFQAAQDHFAWERVAQPLVDFCRAPRRAADHVAGASPLQIPAVKRSIDQCVQLSQQSVQQAGEIERLRSLVCGYERGRFMRLMRGIQRLRTKVRI